jgi:response regulator RpfG family c-di-GMP phosphodiesterase
MVLKSRRILIVDDDRTVRQLCCALFRREYELAEAVNGEDALQQARQFRPDLVLLDLVMPGLDGNETCRQLKLAVHDEPPQIIMVSARSSRQEQLRAFKAGADDYVVKPIDPHELTARVRLHFRLRNSLRSARRIRKRLARHHSQIARIAAERLQEVLATQDVAVFTLAKLAESRDYETGEHLYRMRTYSQILAEQLQLDSPYAAVIDDRFLEDLYRSSPLHDIGKVAISDNILLKPGPLTTDEFNTMKAHTAIGAGILDEAVTHSPCGGFLSMAAIIARYHHERYDGTGYPDGLAGHEIPLPARIVALADVYDALTSVRPYKDGYSAAEARRMIECESGHHFDPVIVEAFRQRFSDFARVPKQRAAVWNGSFPWSPLDRKPQAALDMRAALALDAARTGI